jgi:hypothetical protein
MERASRHQFTRDSTELESHPTLQVVARSLFLAVKFNLISAEFQEFAMNLEAASFN